MLISRIVGARGQRESLEAYQLLIHALDAEKRTRDTRKEDAICAASVEYLCHMAAISCPSWMDLPVYTLSEPWFRGIGAQKPHVQERLKLESPEPFAKRNIYCSATIFANKNVVIDTCSPTCDLLASAGTSRSTTHCLFVGLTYS